jgi:predicted enzyme related to lactoylglutathione lyase
MAANSKGRFVWYDLMTTNPAAAPAFYAPVTGWGTQTWDGPMPYTMWTNKGTPIGGIMQVQNPSAPPHWLAYISSPNVDETIKQGVELGGRVIAPPADIPNVGRYAVAADPQGAVFAAFTPLDSSSSRNGTESQAGEFSWHELASHDMPAAFRFYERLFGWEKMSDFDMGEMGTYQMYGRDGMTLGGMFNKPPQLPVSAWLYYVQVPDVQRAAETVKQQGGQVVHGPMEVPGGDWIAQCLDPQGAMFAVHAKKSA